MKFKIKLNKKAQAAMFDSLFFLIIIVTLSVFLFQYTSTYGNNMERALNNYYFNEYVHSVVRTVYHTSVPLNYSLDFNSTMETDYLISSVKQNYYVLGKIGESEITEIDMNNYNDLSKYNLYNIIKTLMKPLDSYDYIFYLYNTSDTKFEFVLMKVTNVNEKKQKYYLCAPTNYNNVRLVISKTPKIYSSSTPLQFYHHQGNTDVEKKITSTFAIWPSSKDITSEIVEESLKCVVITE